ncbi:MAG: hypothetical protein HOK05_01100 [Nitrosopumilus sp.]|jgi:hypothetical protein|nr:hypothetical protein [Nitrosopumilus sp.]
MSDELQQMLDDVHDGITTFDFEGKETPCIIIEDKKYGLIRAKIEGQPFSVNTDLNILQDGLGNVFVEIILTFSIGNISEKFLINAKTDLHFFEVLATTSMLVVNSPESTYGKDNVIAIQLPRPEKAHDALEIIKNGLMSKNQ